MARGCQLFDLGQFLFFFFFGGGGGWVNDQRGGGANVKKDQSDTEIVML